MSSIKLTADSGGGTFELKAPASSANTRVLTLPDTGNFKIGQESGTIIQAKCSATSSAGQISSTSDSYADVSDIDLVITPKLSNSTMILVTNYHGNNGGANKSLSVRLTFNHSGISQTVVDSNQDGYSIASTGGAIDTFAAMCYTHTPNTTNEITYRFQFRNVGGSGTVYFNRKPSKIIAYEVAV
tara:strand:+ start:1218 stop:1772 length:555 start_codon:yes stop_codon:yes gene_type:complete